MMAYRKNFVVAIKHKGKILRELDESVKLPFGSEYSILLKNKDSRKAVASIEIDGENVVDGNRLIVEPNTTVELKGFMKGSTVRNKFKFIEKTDRISNHRGDRIDDGLVRVEFWFEKEEIQFTPSPQSWYDVWNPPNPNTTLYRSGTGNPSFIGYCNSGPSAVKGLSNTITTNAAFTSNVACNCLTENDNGITVKGSETHQGFSYGTTKALEDRSTVITLKLSGYNERTKKIVKKAVNVKTRINCPTCGIKSKSSAKFCRSCGTYIQ